MKKQYVEVKYYYQAQKICPWASKIIKTEGGFYCFESITDYKTWKDQK